MTHPLALLVIAAASRRLRPWALEQLSHRAAERLAARPWLPPHTLGPIRLGRCAVALAPTADTTATIGGHQ